MLFEMKLGEMGSNRSARLLYSKNSILMMMAFGVGWAKWIETRFRSSVMMLVRLLEEQKEINIGNDIDGFRIDRKSKSSELHWWMIFNIFCWCYLSAIPVKKSLKPKCILIHGWMEKVCNTINYKLNKWIKCWKNPIAVPSFSGKRKTNLLLHAYVGCIAKQGRKFIHRIIHLVRLGFKRATSPTNQRTNPSCDSF